MNWGQGEWGGGGGGGGGARAKHLDSTIHAPSFCIAKYVESFPDLKNILLLN
jgi:hypothetical protein